MSPAQFCDQHAKKEMIALSSPLKINKDFQFIRKSSPSSSSSSSSTSLVNGITNVTNKPPQQRHPVIIYTHSPKIIHTHPKDFMALVQKLTGLSRSDEGQINPPPQAKIEPNHDDDLVDDNNNNIIVHDNKDVMINDDNESTSVVTDEIENNGSSTTTTLGDVGQVNSCFVTPPPPIFDPPNPCSNSIPFLNPNSATDFLCTAQPFYNYSDSLIFMPSIRSSLSSSTLESMKELPEF